MKKFFNEFRQFALKGNVINLAVGVLIGASFQGIVTSFTNHILSPVIGIFANQNFDALEVEVFGATIMYGAFITSIANFLIVAFLVFLLVRFMNRLSCICAKPAKETPPARKCPFCVTEIADEATRCPSCTSVLE